MTQQTCHDCNKEMILVDTIEVLGLDNKISKIEILVCWDCKRYRKNML